MSAIGWKLCGAILTGLALLVGAHADQPPDQQDVWAQPSAPPGAPNIILILLDDVGFGAASTFGGPVETPFFEALAEDGLRYNRFHTTSVCSPTRAALLTGRNQHRVNAGRASGNEIAQRGYSGIWPRSTASIAQVLKDNGYRTAAFGKWHNTPNWEVSPVGPFDRWPTGLGFEYFFGFIGGEADHYAPILYRNTSLISTPQSEGYHLTTSMTDEAIRWLHTHQSLVPDKPYFLYFAPGATHAPHHVPPEWIERYRGHFDQGWDVLREEIFERQKALGVVPEDARLTARPAELPAWSSLSETERKLAARQMEVYAAFLAHTDHEIGRMVSVARDGPGGSNTLVIYIMGDNGASAEGGMHGSDHNLADIFYGLGADSPEVQLSRADDLGSVKLDNHFAVAWAWAVDTPFQWTKQVASHLGGTRNPMVLSWPGHIEDEGGVRSDWLHVVDIVPTIYELVGISPPSMVDGVAQKSIDGNSFADSLISGEARGERTQYFEMFGNRAIYKNGWMASAIHSLPWILRDREASFSDDEWELYNLEEDFSQAENVADRYPAKLAELRQAFEIEAERNDVLPLIADLGFTNRKPNLHDGRSEFYFFQDSPPIPSLSGLPLLMGPHRIETRIEVPEGTSEGVIVSNGGRDGGFTLFLDDGYLTYEYNLGGKRSTKIKSYRAIQSGSHDIALDWSAPDNLVTLSLDGEVVGETTIEQAAPASYLGAFCVGRDCGTPVSNSYAAPNTFIGKIEPVLISLPE